MDQATFVRTQMLLPEPPPVSERGMIKWGRENLFAGWLNTALTVGSIAVIAWLAAAAAPWLLRSVWVADNLSECRSIIQTTWGEGATGACWAVIRERWTQFIYGFYPQHLYWRPNLAFILLFVSLAPVLFTGIPRIFLLLSVVYPGVAYWLLWGGTLWFPVAAYLGPFLGFLIYRLFRSSNGALALALSVLSVVMWWMLVAGPLDRALRLGVDAVKVITTAISLAAAIIVFREVAMQRSKALAALAALVALMVIWGPIAGTVVIRWAEDFGAVSTQGFGLLEPVRSDRFGGFLLSVIIGVTAIGMSLPLGIVLALGRKSNLFLIKSFAVIFIEFIRGVPLITLLFVASLLLNYFLPPGTTFDIILRVVIMVTLFAAAYIAEVIRGGLAALPKGQQEAADALGLNYWQAQRLIILPQALKISIPGIVSTFIGLFKDTTLVVFVGLLDPLKGITDSVRAHTDWKGIYWEPYIFVGVLFFIFCFGMSRYSMYLERKLKTDHR